jgi:hypothetical protein
MKLLEKMGRRASRPPAAVPVQLPQVLCARTLCTGPARLLRLVPGARP